MTGVERPSQSEAVFSGVLALGMTAWAGVILWETFLSGKMVADVSAPAVFPGIVCCLLVGLAAATVVRAVRRRDGAEAPQSLENETRGARLRVAGVLALLIGFAAAIPVLGFYVATPIAAAAIAMVAGTRNPVSLLVLAASLTLSLYVLFSLILRVPLPPGLLRAWGF